MFFGNRDIGIDLGTANVLVYQSGKGIVLREPSVVAINSYTNEPVAFGIQAKEMLGRTPGNIVAIRPIKDGVIANFDITIKMLKFFIKKATKGGFARPRVVICIPCGVTDVERRAIQDATKSAGVKEVYLIEEPMAAAIGAGIAVEEPLGAMVVDIGGGTSEVAVLSYGGIVSSVSVKVAGDAFDAAITAYMRKKYSVMIGERTAEEIKITIGTAYPRPKDESMMVKGRDLVTGLPKTIELMSSEVMEAMSEAIGEIIDAIKNTLEKTPPELAADLLETGITLTGGGALIYGLDKLIRESVHLPVNIAEDPLDCVASGSGQVTEDFDNLYNVLLRGK